ncbi:MAG: 2Fe-2S iron-sulfur cluster-binding protein [Gammaproteobacteria bacterium]
MPTVIYIDTNGERHEEEVEVGFTLMDGAFNRELPGMLAECGGAAACGTCHCYIDEEWLNRIPPIEDLEDSMLYMVNDRRSNSRLTCQINVTEELDGIKLEIADNEF